MNRGNDVTEAMKRQIAQSGEVVEGTSQVAPGSGSARSSEVSPVTQQSPAAAAQLTQSPLQHFMVTGQVQQVQVQQLPVQNVTLASPQQVTSPRAGQPQQLLAHMQGLRVPVSVAGAVGGGTGVGTGTTNSPVPTPAVSLPFTLSPGAAAVLSQHGITTQALSRLYAATTTVTAVGGGGGAQTAPGGGGTLQRHLATGTAGMMVVPQLGPSAGFQQVVGHSPATSGHGTTTALLLTHTQDARELQIARPTTATPAQQPVTQVQVAGTLPATSTVSASGGTIHHHGQSPTRGGVIPPLANPVQHQPSQPNLMASINLQQQLSAAASSGGGGTSPVAQTAPSSTATSPGLLLVSPSASVNQGSGGGGSTPTTPTQGPQTIRRLSGVGSLSPGVSPQRTSPLLAFGQLPNTQRTSPMQSPERVRKRIKLEEVPAATPDVATHRKLICDEKLRQMKEIKENYNEHLTELFFLQNGGNSMDYHACKKRPTVQLLHFLKSGNLDSDDDEEIPVGTETKINDEVKVITTSGGTTPLATPVAISTTLPPAITAMQQQANSGDPGKKLGGRHGMVFGHVQPTSVQQMLPQIPGRGGVALMSSPATTGTAQSSYSLVLQTTTAATATTAPTVTTATTKPTPATQPPVTTSTTTTSASPNLTSQLAKVMAETPVPAAVSVVSTAASVTVTTAAATKSLSHSSSTVAVTTVTTTTSTVTTPSATASGSLPAIKSPNRPAAAGSAGRLSTRQHSISAVYDTAIGSQEAIVERAKQEAQVMQRVAELRKEGLWSSRRLPKVQEPPRNKAHWDYLLEEMQWLAADFAQERKWKKAGAKKIARMIMKYFQEQQQKELRAEKEEANRTRRIASNMAKMMKEFWSNIEKVVQYKQQSRLEEKRKKALDLHLSFIVDQTEKYSSWLTEGLQAAGNSSIASSSVPASPRSVPDDGDFEPNRSESDDEETIAKEEQECALDESEQQEELTELERESTMPLDELLNSLPKEILEKPASLEPTNQERGSEDGVSVKSSVKDEDDEFNASEESAEDDEDTIAAQEKKERKTNHREELADLEAEQDLPIEELYKKYAGAYDEDFEAQMSEKSTDVEDDSDEESDEEEEEESEEEEEEEEEQEEDQTDGDDLDEIGVEYLFNPDNAEQDMETDQIPATTARRKAEPQQPQVPQKAGDKSPSKDITDIAATAMSLQPTGYTLETTRVITPVPFLIKHSLREYQHVGLDWLATMHDRKLNGILADEMGLGKTIQTIALLAHLACEKEVWGPHLIVVPTSVMLNWEMEFKKWCPAFKILTYYGSQKERKAKRTGWTKTNAFHVCITSYKLVIQDHQAFRRKKWKYFILDEAQNIKNFKSQRWQTLLNFQSQRRLLLTGTPLQNSLMELWSLMHFLMPHVFASHREFKEWFSNPLSGMIEGSREYNENLIKRLHKVLRPFLLRRLKADVEKQMPKKYEHVVMCRLSKRQRYLYDDFMAQAKTKETLASGHFMSVINILMQLRKVCNHPNLFDPRPVISSFQQQGLSYTAASLVLRALHKLPLQHLSSADLHPCLADLEVSLPAFAAHRIRKLQTPKSLIEEIENHPPPSPRPKPLQKPIKLDLSLCQSVLPQVGGQASPKSGSRAGSPVTILRSSTPTPTAPSSLVKTPTSTQVTQSRTATPPTRAVAPLQVITSTTPAVTTPAAVATTQLVQLPGHTPTTASLAARMPSTQPQTSLAIVTTTSAGGVQTQQALPITVQFHQTQQGTRLMIPSGQLSQLPAGFIQIVQTASGQQIIATQAPTQAGQTLQLAPTPQPVANGPTSTTVPSAMAATLPSTTQLVTTSVTTRPVTSLNLPTSSVSMVGGKPVVRVSPLAQTPATTSVASGATSSAVKATTSTVKATTSTVKATTSLTTAASKSLRQQQAENAAALEKLKKSPFFLEDIHQKRVSWQRSKLQRIARNNKRHCEVKPVYGQDLCQAVNIYTPDYTRHCDRTRWKGLGYLHCHDVHMAPAQGPAINRFWRQADALRRIVHTPEQYLHELKDVMKRFVFDIPVVNAPVIQIHASHPPPSLLNAQRMLVRRLHHELSPKAALLHPIYINRTIQCPEARLIQYDCGKLQTLDTLLRQLKSGQHRVLIFTQMTKMLDVLEAFLNYHGHRYLRLDGTTRVEQRQVLMERFNMDRRIFCFILSTRSGGIGVNLTGADTVIFYDSDWNPTMDAQAQDRCHRIGQTRDVHIYRLISERTVEENILKKANQKRLLGDVAIEGGNFTTAFFRENTLQELFAEPSGLQQLAKEKEQQRINREEQLKKEAEKPDLDSSMTNEQIEQALCGAEDETDVQAAKVVAAEQKAELAEFDENIPWDEKEEASRREEEDVSKVEQELAMLEKELTSVERYAVGFMEGQMSPLQEELDRAEEEVTLAKEEWELTRLKALRQEEERRAELEEDEMLFTYSRHDAYNQVYVCDETGEQLPIWSPPTPPQDDNDVYIDQTICFLYEPTVMAESQLPPVYVKKEHKRVRVEAHPGRKPKVRKDDQPRVPRSLFDRPSAALRRDAKQLVKLKQAGISRLFKPNLPSSAGRPLLDAPEHPEWLIHEDWALLQAVQILLELPLNLSTPSPAHIPNWDLVADVVNAQSRTYRSPKQCKNRYENVIVPREEGKILYDINPRKQKKSKGIYKTKNNRPMRTSQLFVQDNNGSITTLNTLRFDSAKAITAKRTPTLRPTLANPTLKNPKHAAVLAESGINYDTPMTPTQVATIRAERIAKEKKQAAAVAAQELAQQNATSQQSATTTTTTTSTAEVASATATATATGAGVTAATTQQPQMTIVQGQPLTPVATTAVLQAGSLPKATVTAVSLARSLGATGSIVVNTPGVSGNTFATINKRVSQSVAGAAIQVTTTIPRTLTQQTLTAAIANQQRAAAAAAVTAAGATSQVLTTTTLTPGTVVAQRLGTVTATSVTPGSMQQALTTATRPMTPQLLLKRATYLKQQQLRAQGRLPATIQADQLKQQQQMKRLQQTIQQQQQQQAATTTVVSLQKAVNVSSPLVTSMAQPAQVTQARLQAPNQKIKRAFTEADMAAIIKRQQQQLLQQKMGQQQASGSQQLTGAQIISGAQVVGQAASSSQNVATLVKTVSSPSGSSMPSVTIPVSAVSLGNVNISVSVPQQKATTSKVTQQQLRQIQQLQLPQRKVALQQSQHKVPALTQSQMQQMKGQLTTPLIIQQQQQQIIKHPLNAQQLQQIMQQQKSQQVAAAQQQQVGTIQQIITSVAPPTTVILTQGLQAQSMQAAAKVSQALSIGGTTIVSQPSSRVAAPVTVTALPAATNTVTVVSHGVPGVSTVNLTSPTVTLTSSPQTTLVKHVHDTLGSPAKALPVTQATLAQLKAVQQVAVGRQVTGVATTMQGQTVHVTQVPGVQPIRAPSMAVQQAVQQVQAQAQQQRQQAMAAAAASQASGGAVTVASVPSATTMVQVTQQGQVVQAVAQQQQQQQQPGAVGQDGKSSPYAMRLRNPQKH